MQRQIQRQWFRRRRIGFGWRPATWQGWLITAAAAGLVIGTLAAVRGSSQRLPIVIGIVALYAVVALATGGTRAAEEAPLLPEPEPAAEAYEPPARPVP
ncbi:MAG TPA: hypothetical protein VN770_11075, partial [Gaiellaceae bacterium]|nr:hypothetical protein [Gaiellaceae bacterium]